MDERRTVLVTGASSGIGEACAARLAREGFLVFAGVRKEADAERLRRELGDAVAPVTVDVTDAPSIAAAAASIDARAGGRLDGLVNNAGIGVTGPIEYLPLDDLRRQFEVNVFGQVAVTQAMLPLVRAARGRIVDIGSVGSHLAIPFGGALCASKSALTMLNDALRLELHAFGIHVCLVEPASIHTPAVDKTLGDVDRAIERLPPEGRARYGDMLRAWNRRALAREESGSPPDEVARTVFEALTSKRPRPRYVVGKDATVLSTLPRVLSDRLLDRLRLRMFGLAQPFGARGSAP